MRKLSLFIFVLTAFVELSAQNASNKTLDSLMRMQDQYLQEVQVTGKKSTMKLKVDRKEFDVSSLLTTAGQTASEVLENIPSVEVDQEGNVSLRGNSSVEVRINGRTSGLTEDNRAQILQQLPAESIERIEVIDNPSAKFSAEGSAGIINIILKKDRKAGYYGSVQAGANTRSGANTSASINYNDSKLDAYFNIGYRHRESKGLSDTEQDNLTDGIKTSFERHHAINRGRENNLFSRAGFTWHATDKDDFSLGGMLFTGKRKSYNSAPYYYGLYNADGTESLYRIRQRDDSDDGPMRMVNGEFGYRHEFAEKHMLNLLVSHNNWHADNSDVFQDRIIDLVTEETPVESYEKRPLLIRNHSTEVKLDYENQMTEDFKLETGYNGNFNRENSPQEAWRADNWEGTDLVEDKAYFNRFIYNIDIHALYATATYAIGKLNVMAGLRGEYWKVKTESLNWNQEHGISEKNPAFKKDYFQLFPSLFMSYQLTSSQQLQLNYTRRLRRPWGGQLNNFKNTEDASITSFGNPLLTPEFSNSFSINYLKTWEQHSLLVSSYYRPTTDVIQRINYRGTDGRMYSTSENVAKSLSTGIEVTAKNKFGRALELTTNVNAYYYKLNAFNYVIEDQMVSGKAEDNFTWNARIIASIILPWDISIQTSGRFNSRQVITQGYRPASAGMDLGIKKNFLNRALVFSVNCRDVFNSRKWITYTSSDSFWRYSLRKRNSRTVNFTLTWNFGNSNNKKRRGDMNGDNDDEEMNIGGYDM